MGFVKHETGCSQLFPLEVFGLHKIEQQLPISHKSQKPCAVPASSCTDPLRGSEKHPEQIPSTVLRTGHQHRRSSSGTNVLETGGAGSGGYITTSSESDTVLSLHSNSQR